MEPEPTTNEEQNCKKNAEGTRTCPILGQAKPLSLDRETLPTEAEVVLAILYEKHIKNVHIIREACYNVIRILMEIYQKFELKTYTFKRIYDIMLRVFHKYQVRIKNFPKISTKRRQQITVLSERLLEICPCSCQIESAPCSCGSNHRLDQLFFLKQQRRGRPLRPKRRKYKPKKKKIAPSTSSSTFDSIGKKNSTGTKNRNFDKNVYYFDHDDQLRDFLGSDDQDEQDQFQDDELDDPSFKCEKIRPQKQRFDNTIAQAERYCLSTSCLTNLINAVLTDWGIITEQDKQHQTSNNRLERLRKAYRAERGIPSDPKEKVTKTTNVAKSKNRKNKSTEAKTNSIQSEQGPSLVTTSPTTIITETLSVAATGSVPTNSTAGFIIKGENVSAVNGLMELSQTNQPTTTIEPTTMVQPIGHQVIYATTPLIIQHADNAISTGNGQTVTHIDCINTTPSSQLSTFFSTFTQ